MTTPRLGMAENGIRAHIISPASNQISRCGVIIFAEIAPGVVPVCTKCERIEAQHTEDTP